MKVKCALLAVSMLCIGLAACGESTLLSPAESPRYDGGGGFGSGNRAMQMDSTPAATAWGGGGFGSGN